MKIITSLALAIQMKILAMRRLTLFVYSDFIVTSAKRQLCFRILWRPDSLMRHIKMTVIKFYDNGLLVFLGEFRNTPLRCRSTN